MKHAVNLVPGACRRLATAGLCLSLAVPAGGMAQTNAPAEPKLWFHVGEELVYSLYWGMLPIGETRVTTTWIDEEGQRRLQIRDRTRSSKLIATLYPVDDVVEAIVDPVPFRSIRFTKNLKEGRHRYHEVTTFDYDRMTAHWESKITKEQKDYAIAADTRDLLTFMYYTRSQDIAAGAGKTYGIVADDKVYNVTYAIECVEGVKLGDYGSVPSFKIKPQTGFQGLFVHTGQILLWVSRDARHLGTKVVGATPVGHVRAVLSEVNGPGDDFWIRRGRE